MQRFVVNPFKCLLGTVCAVFFAVMGVTMAVIGRPLSCAVFLALGAVFAVIAVQAGAVLELSGNGVCRRVLGRPGKALRWDEIAEIGVGGTKVFNRRNPDKVGGLYFYFSPAAMTESERFEMMLKWPPSDKLYMIFDDRRYRAVQTYWNGTLEKYNTGKLVL